MKKMDAIKFKKIKWVITDIKVSMAKVTYYKYKVYRKYCGIWLNNTKCTYHISPRRWNYLKMVLKKNKNFHYTQVLFTKTL